MGEKSANCDSSVYFSESILSCRADQIYLLALFLWSSFGATSENRFASNRKDESEMKRNRR
jgi:hypothetical protein